MKPHVMAHATGAGVDPPTPPTIGAGILLKDPQEYNGLRLGTPTIFGSVPAGDGTGLRLIDPQGVSGLLFGTPVYDVTPPIPVAPPTVNSVVSIGTTSLRVSWTDNQTIPADSFTLYIRDALTTTLIQTLAGLTGSSYDVMSLIQDTPYTASMIAVVGGVESGLSNTVTGTPTTSIVLFYDDFSSGSLNFVSPSSAGWEYAKSGQGGVIPTVTNEKFLTGGYSCKFDFPANSPSTVDSILSELGFGLGVETREFWVKFVVLIPSNYVHAAPLAGTNCKIMYLDSNGGAGSFFGLEAWWGTEFGTNSGYAIPNHKNGEIYDSHRRDTTHMPWGDTNTGAGKWHEWIVYHKLSTPTVDGTCKIWIDGTLWSTVTDMDGYSAPDYYSNGYIMGAQNAVGGSWPVHLTYYIDEFTLSTNEIVSAGGFPKDE